MEAFEPLRAYPFASEQTALQEQLRLLFKPRFEKIIVATELCGNSEMKSTAVRAVWAVACAPLVGVMPERDGLCWNCMEISNSVLNPAHDEHPILDAKGGMMSQVFVFIVSFDHDETK